MQYGTWDLVVYEATAYLMLYAPLQLSPIVNCIAFILSVCSFSSSIPCSVCVFCSCFTITNILTYTCLRELIEWCLPALLLRVTFRIIRLNIRASDLISVRSVARHLKRKRCSGSTSFPSTATHVHSPVQSAPRASTHVMPWNDMHHRTT